MDLLAGDVARAGTAEKANGGRNFIWGAALACERPMREVMLRLGASARRADEPGRDEIRCDVILRQVMRERTGETGEAGLGGDDVGAMLRPGIGAQAADVDDRTGVTASEMRQTRFH